MVVIERKPRPNQGKRVDAEREREIAEVIRQNPHLKLYVLRQVAGTSDKVIRHVAKKFGLEILVKPKQRYTKMTCMEWFCSPGWSNRCTGPYERYDKDYKHKLGNEISLPAIAKSAMVKGGLL